MKKSLLLLLVLLPGSFSGLVSGEKKDDWIAMPVPATWEAGSGGKLAKYDGYAWYRCWVKVPEAWKGNELTLSIDRVDNAHEAYWEGTLIGKAGDFPPKFRDATWQVNSYSIADKLVRPGAYHLLAIRVFDSGGEGGIKGAPPAIVNEAQAISLQGTWQLRTGDNLAWAKPADDRPRDVALFAKVQDTASLTRIEGKQGGLKPADAAKSFTVAPDLRWDQVLAEPLVGQPVSLSFDERGRLWVVNYLQYPNPAGLKMLSRDIYWRAIYDKMSPPPPKHFRGKDKITIHEDSDGDGVFDKHSVFVDGLNITTSVLPGRGGAFVLNPPYLLFYPSKDGNTPSGDPVVHLRGFGIEDTHSMANSLRWGPDGWIYGAHGSTVTAKIICPLAPGADKAPPVTMIGQHIWRYHPEKHIFEVFGEGGGNAFGVEIDRLGRVFSGHNGGNTRGFHYVQGGSYRKGFEKHGQLANPFSFGFFEAMKHPAVARFSHTFTMYEGQTLPAKYHGKMFAVAPLQNQIMWTDVLPDQTSVQTKDIEPVVATKDSWFRPVDIQPGPAGALFVADWYDGNVGHYRAHEGVLDQEMGRIYRLTRKDHRPSKPVDLGKKTTAELIDLLGHEDRWTRQTSLRLLGDRRDPAAREILVAKVKKSQGQQALDALWALHLSGGFNDQLAIQFLLHSEPAVRAWTIRLLGDDGQRVDEEVARNLAIVAGKDKDATVRSQLASTARRLPTPYGLPILGELMRHDEDAADIHIPLLLWWALEKHCGTDAAAVQVLMQDRRLWDAKLVQETILPRLIRRQATLGTQKDLQMCVALFRQAPDARRGKILLAGFEEAFKGRSIAGLPPELLEEIAKLGGGSVAFAVRQGKTEAVEQALGLVKNSKTNVSQREELAILLGEARQTKCIPLLLEVVAANEPLALRKTALAALQNFKDEAIGQKITGLYPSLPTDLRETAELLLTSRKEWGRQLLAAVDGGAISSKALPLTAVKKLLLLRDEPINNLVKKHYGEVKGATTAQMQLEMERCRQVVSAGAGNPYAGKKLYGERCASCHVLHSQGGSVGPDLTPYKRDDTAQLLLHIVNPSAEIREGYEQHLVFTESGRSVAGVLVDKDARVVVLKTADGQKVTLPKDDVAEMSVTGVSLMPEALLAGLSDQQVRDLFAYLRSTQPLNEAR